MSTVVWGRGRMPTPPSPRTARTDLRAEGAPAPAAAACQRGPAPAPAAPYAVPYASPVSVGNLRFDSDSSDDERAPQPRLAHPADPGPRPGSPDDGYASDADAAPAPPPPEPLAISHLLPLAQLLLTSLFPPSQSSALYPLNGFIKEMVTRSGTAPETLALGLLYLWRCRDRIARNRSIASASLAAVQAIPHPSLCARRMFLSALVVAWKFLSDRTYTNSAWSKISGLRCEEVNSNERVLLGMLGWTLDVKPAEWEGWRAWIQDMKGQVSRIAADAAQRTASGTVARDTEDEALAATAVQCVA
ncbi:hypothetical protein DFJ74DRAFT_662244 [Hyaloraphidium curvatum]|nr:hypothetical protein DFJ74DRAFT_662244 [Hyaloraphidium curvatum]